MNWMENCSFVGHYIFMKMWWKCVHVFDTCFLAHFIWKFPPPKINSEGSVLVTVMSSVLVYLGLFSISIVVSGAGHDRGELQDEAQHPSARPLPLRHRLYPQVILGRRRSRARDDVASFQDLVRNEHTYSLSTLLS